MILHIDSEGGWGGASRSLYELVSRLGGQSVVAYREKGPAAGWYESIGVPAYHVPEIFAFMPRDKGLKSLVVSAPSIARLRQAANQLSRVVDRHRIKAIHLNHEGLFLLAKLLPDLPVIAHCRTMLARNRWGRWVAREIAKADRILWISPNERDRFRELRNGHDAGEVMWNIARTPYPRGERLPEVVYLGSVDPSKGVDRLLAVAGHFNSPVTISVYGSARRNPRFERMVGAQSSDRIVFRGHTGDPMQPLSNALALIRPSRGNDPWGRDVIEAAAAGVPVIASGSYDGVVKDGKTGFLLDPFDPRKAAALVDMLYTDLALWQCMSDTSMICKKFSGELQAARFSEIAASLMGSRT